MRSLYEEEATYEYNVERYKVFRIGFMLEVRRLRDEKPLLS